MPSPCVVWRSLLRAGGKFTVFAIVAVIGTAGSLGAQSDSTARDSATALAAILVSERANTAGTYSAYASRSAMRTQTLLRDTPLSVTTVTTTLIRDQRMQSLSDVVRFVPGVTMGQGEGHRDQPTIRGNNTTADFFVDGVRDDAQYIRDLYNAERIESIRGSNAVTFGRGGGGGVINRVTKEADWRTVTDVSIEGGFHDHKRASLDVGRTASSVLAGRLNAVYQNSGTYRDEVRLDRLGVNPTMAARVGSNARLRASYEYFKDHRTVDRGVPSVAGRPAQTPRSRFFGNPDSSYYDALVHAAAVVLEAGSSAGISVRSNSRFGRYDKFYQNVFPGAVNASGDMVALLAYSNATLRTSLVNQTDAIVSVHTGSVRHTLLLGGEIGRSITDNTRLTGYFNGGTAPSTSVDFEAPTVRIPVAFRPSASDPNTNTVLHTAAIVVQDQAAITPWLQAIAGARLERFDLAFADNRNGDDFAREDVMLSPRAGLVLKPAEALSVYATYGVSWLPSSGDQFASLNLTSSALEPERFVNREAGVKWEPVARLAFTGAVYQLDRTNTTARDPGNPALTVQTGSQRSSGLEFTAAGLVTPVWQLVGVLSSQSATITSTTTAAPAGATVPLVPKLSASLWNKYRLSDAFAVGAGVVHQGQSYAAIDNTVTLPAFTRVDLAVYATTLARLRLQLNVENLFDSHYFATAHSNNNITPGGPRSAKLTASFTP